MKQSTVERVTIVFSVVFVCNSRLCERPTARGVSAGVGPNGCQNPGDAEYGNLVRCPWVDSVRNGRLRRCGGGARSDAWELSVSQVKVLVEVWSKHVEFKSRD